MKSNEIKVPFTVQDFFFGMKSKWNVKDTVNFLTIMGMVCGSWGMVVGLYRVFKILLVLL